MKNLAVARRYAKALLLIAKEDGNAETYREELDRISGLIEREKELDSVLSNPLYDSEGRKKILEIVIEKLKLSVVMRSFLLLLFDKGRVGFINNINEFYQQLVDELNGIARASLTSATKLADEVVDKIGATLSKMTGKDVVLDVEHDPSLIGGVVSRIGDLVLDGSIKTQLLNMRESLKRGESV